MTATRAGRDRSARTAALLYLAMGLPIAFDMMVVRKLLVVPNDGAATIARILASETLFRLGIAGGVISSLAAVMTAALLHRVFEPVDRTLARLMAWFLLLSVPIVLLNLVHATAALSLLTQGGPAGAAGPAQDPAAALMLLKMEGQGLVMAQVFWGAWLLPLGLLVIRSRTMPRTIGVLLLAAGCAYLLSSMTWIVAPQLSGFVTSAGMLPEAAGEVSFIAWLLVKGVGGSGEGCPSQPLSRHGGGGAPSPRGA